MRRHRVPVKVVNVLVADENIMVCELIANLLRHSPAIKVVGWVLDSESALASVRDTSIDIALISSDLKDGPGKGLSLAYALRISYPAIRSIILLDALQRQNVLESFRAGARGVLSRGSGLSSLVKCVCCVSKGQVWADTETLTYLADATFQPAATHCLTDTCSRLLTEREKVVVQLVADGLSNREIAEQLKLSPYTVRNYLFHVFDKMGVSSRIELVLAAVSTCVKESQLASDGERLAMATRALPDTVGDA